MPKRFWCFPAVWPIRPQAPRLAKDMGWRGDPCHMHTISRHPRDWHMMEMAKQHITYIIIIDRFIAVDSWESVYNKMYICAKERDMTHIIFIYAVYNSKGCTIQLLWYIHLQKTTYTHRHIIYIYVYIHVPSAKWSEEEPGTPISDETTKLNRRRRPGNLRWQLWPLWWL